MNTYRVVARSKIAGRRARLIYVRADDVRGAASEARDSKGKNIDIVSITRCSEAEFEKYTRGR